MCRSRGAHVACTHTYIGEGARKKIRPRTYIQAGSRMPTRAYVHGWVGTEKHRRRRVHGEATECILFMGRQRNARVHREATEHAGANRLGRNGMRGHVHREGLDGIGDGKEAWRTAQRRKQTSYVRNGVLLIGRGLAYRKTEETDLLRSKRGSCSSGGVWRTAKRRKQTFYGRNGGPVDRD